MLEGEMITAIGIVCKDIEQTIKFYEYLGLSFKQIGGPDHFETYNNKAFKVMLDSEHLIKQLYPSWQRQHNQNVSLCFELKEPEKVDQIFSDLIECGGVAIKKPWDAFWGQRYASLLDPNSNQIDLYAAL
ncbi:MAG TPA: glyoxalase [Oligoflexia bacterium]|nr:glyoxalase [Oligoflexia bacterium]HMR24238.1 glyoxalase [Oligoflexia bacterium]